MRYLGGKSQSGTYQRIINLIPPHEVYVEPFLGGGAIARLKRPALLSYGVDLAPPEMTLDVPGMSVVRGCGMAFMEGFRWRGVEFVYCDPPYMWETRRSRHRYPWEFVNRDHRRLLRIVRWLSELGVKVMVSGYATKLYDRELAGWNREEFQVWTRGHTPATEVLGFNYERPEVLHDLRYVGRDYRERLRIKRKQARWRARFERLPVLERAVLFAALVEAMGEGASHSVGIDAAAGGAIGAVALE